jgi:hypothetical protein
LSDTVLDIANKVTRRYLTLGSESQKSYKEFIMNCQISENPKTLGTFKKGTGLNCYVAELNNSIRVAYDVYEDKKNNRKVITIFNLGDHKEVYGKDK